MQSGPNKVMMFLLSAAILLALALPAHAAGKAQTLVGEVSDAMCGAAHMMEGGAADCTRQCVAKGSKYALIVGDKVYTLDTTDKGALDQLDKLSGLKAKVTGAVEGDKVQVSAVAAAK